MKGAAEMAATLRRVSRAFPDKVAMALRDELEIEKEESQRRCPVSDISEPEHVHLRDTAAVSVQRDGNRIRGTISYNKDYATIVHEDLDAIHPVGEAKYLESVLNESASSLTARVGRHVSLDKA